MAAVNQARPYHNQPYLPNGATPGGPSGPVPGATPLLPNQGRVVQQGSVKILCIADIRGHLQSLNQLAAAAKADYVIHTGDFGFYDDSSLDRIAEKTLKHVAQYSPLISDNVKRQIANSPPNPPLKERFSRDELPLSEFPKFLRKELTLNVPVYTVWGACEDVQVLEKLRSGEYKVNNLHIIDEAHSRLLDVGGVKLRLLGLGGAVVMHKLFDNGEGRTTIAGGQGTMWTTLLQMGELIDTANRVYDPTETRLFVTHASPAREGLLNQLSVALKSDFSISAGLHFRYGSSYNEFSVNPSLDHYRGKLAASKASFNDVWETVKAEVEPAVADNESQQRLLAAAIDVIGKMPSVANGGNPFGGQVGGPQTGQVDESAFKNMWNFNLADAAFGWLILEVEGGRIATEMKAQGFNFAHRMGKQAPNQAQQQGAPVAPVTGGASPVPPIGPAAPSQPANRGPVPAGAVAQQNSAQPPRGPQAAQQPAPPQTQAKPATPVATPARASPAPVAQKAPTPQPAASPAPAAAASEKAIPSEVKPNGTTPAEKPAESTPTPKAFSPAPEPRKQSSALFIQNVDSEEAVRNLFSEDDKKKITKVEQKGRNFVAHFSSPEETGAVLNNLPQENKGRTNPGKPNVQFFKERTYPDRNDGAGKWQPSHRGGAQGDARGGYRSGGASDSEGGRGRGGFRGGRGSGRGVGERGRGRGGRGGATAGEGASPATTPAAS